jgi:heme iron utilization protein
VAEEGESREPKMAEGPAPAWQARTLLRAARSAVLATSHQGAPFASLVTPAFAPDLAAVMWLSRLSDHTRHLMEEPRCALLVQGAAAGPNPQTAPRVALTGRAERIEDDGLKARWLAVHPYAAMYAGFGDFSLWRVVPEGAHLVAGFARAFRLGPAKLLAPDAAVRAVAAGEAAVMAHCNTDHSGAMELLGRYTTGENAEWRMVALDTDGFDVSDGTRSVRIGWESPIVDTGAVRNALVTMLGRMRGG